MITLITGSSASGKTTIGSMLADKYKFQQLDGDQIIKDLGLTSKSWNKIHDEIFRKSLQMHANGDVVITHVVLPRKLSLYQKFYSSRKITFNIVVLNPKKAILMNRNEIRTCHPKPTPPDVIDFFHDEFNKTGKIRSNLWELDNSNEISEDTVNKILNLLDQ